MELHPKRKRRWSAEEREQLVANYQASGKTQKSFCSESGMSVASLTNWLRQSRGGSDLGQLIEVPLPVANAGSVEVEVTLPGMTVKIPVGTPTSWAGELLHALRCGA